MSIHITHSAKHRRYSAKQTNETNKNHTIPVLSQRSHCWGRTTGSVYLWYLVKLEQWSVQHGIWLSKSLPLRKYFPSQGWALDKAVSTHYLSDYLQLPPSSPFLDDGFAGSNGLFQAIPKQQHYEVSNSGQLDPNPLSFPLDFSASIYWVFGHWINK